MAVERAPSLTPREPLPPVSQPLCLPRAALALTRSSPTHGHASLGGMGTRACSQSTATCGSVAALHAHGAGCSLGRRTSSLLSQACGPGSALCPEPSLWLRPPGLLLSLATLRRLGLSPLGLHTHDLHGQEGHSQRCALTLLTAGLRRTDYSPSSSYTKVCATGSTSQRKHPQESFTPESRMGQTQDGVNPWNDSAAIRGPAVTCMQSVERTTLHVIPFTGAGTETESRRRNAGKRDRAVEMVGLGHPVRQTFWS